MRGSFIRLSVRLKFQKLFWKWLENGCKPTQPFTNHSDSNVQIFFPNPVFPRSYFLNAAKSLLIVDLGRSHFEGSFSGVDP